MSAKKFKCSVDGCFKEYISNHYLKLHVQKVHTGTFQKFGCNFCSSTFMSKFSRDMHIVSAHTGEKAYKCEKCLARFSRAQELKKHGITHTDEKPHKCLICLKQYKTKKILKLHSETVHAISRQKSLKCSTCSKAFITRTQLKRHSLTHRDVDKFGCYFCKKKFNQKLLLENHTRIHTQEKPFYCKVNSCQYSSCWTSNVTNHKKIHHSPGGGRIQCRIWTCYFCNKICARFTDLVSHFRVHTRETPFSCGLCQRQFKNLCNLRNHISSHTKEKPYKCEECGRCFSVRWAFTSHVRAFHRGERRYFCTFCNYSAFLKKDFEGHVLRHEKKILNDSVEQSKH